MISMNPTLLRILSERFTNFKVFDTSQIEFINGKYDLILFNNVFSVIPFDTEIKNIIQFIKSHLSDEGKALISIKFKNSYFDKYQEREFILSITMAGLLPIITKLVITELSNH